jgi:hypothetical protein
MFDTHRIFHICLSPKIYAKNIFKLSTNINIPTQIFDSLNYDSSYIFKQCAINFEIRKHRT